jgi:hypothetical protein
MFAFIITPIPETRGSSRQFGAVYMLNGLSGTSELSNEKFL